MIQFCYFANCTQSPWILNHTAKMRLVQTFSFNSMGLLFVYMVPCYQRTQNNWTIHKRFHEQVGCEHQLSFLYKVKFSVLLQLTSKLFSARTKL